MATMRVLFKKSVQAGANDYYTILEGTKGTVQQMNADGLVDVVADHSITSAGIQGDTSATVEMGVLMILPGS